MAIFRVAALAHVEVMVEAKDADDAGYRVMTAQVDNPVEICDVFDIDEVEEVEESDEESAI